MKKWHLVFFAFFLTLAACGAEEAEESVDDAIDEPLTEEVEREEEPVEDPIQEEVQEEVEKEMEEPVEEPAPAAALTEAEVKELIAYHAIGEADSLSDVSVQNREIKATISLGPTDPFSPSDMAVTRYSQLSDELLTHEGWDTLTVTFSNIGTVSMHRDEKESNEYGDYFPSLQIEERLH
jgi:hypothetical protein